MLAFLHTANGENKANCSLPSESQELTAKARQNPRCDKGIIKIFQKVAVLLTNASAATHSLQSLAKYNARHGYNGRI